MPIKIIRQESESKPLKVDLLINTLEASKDRVRTTGNMLITAVSILLPACLALLLFIADKRSTNLWAIMLLVIALFLFLVSCCLSIISSFLKKHIALDEAEFVEGLLADLHRETRMISFAFLLLIFGMLTMIVAVITFALN